MAGEISNAEFAHYQRSKDIALKIAAIKADPAHAEKVAAALNNFGITVDGEK